MKRIEAIIHAFKLEDVKETLMRAGIQGMTVSEVREFGQKQNHKEIYRGRHYAVDFIPKVRIEIVVPDENALQTVQTITESARTGKLDDGKILVATLDEVIRIRTGERGAEAI